MNKMALATALWMKNIMEDPELAKLESDTGEARGTITVEQLLDRLLVEDKEGIESVVTTLVGAHRKMVVASFITKDLDGVKVATQTSILTALLLGAHLSKEGLL